MILQALKEYYDRKAADCDSEIAPEGWEKKEIPYVIVLDNKGNFIQIEDTRQSEGRKKKAKVFLVPRSVNRSSEISANLLWDKAEYIFAGVEVKKDKVKLKKQREAFVARLEDTLGELECIRTVIRFINDSATNTPLVQDFCWEEIKKTNPIIGFRMVEDTNLICNREDVRSKINEFIKAQAQQGNKTGICLISGEPGVIAKTHNKTFINRKNNSLISFQKNCGYDSYCKEQGYNAPISRSSEYAYVTALNTLLKSNRQRFSIGDGVYVCWSKDKSNFETEFSLFFDDAETRDNPDLYSDKVKSLFKSIDTGAFIKDEGNQKFYVLGLSPGGGTRISVRFWEAKTVSELAVNIYQHFDDLSIIKPPNYPEYFNIWRVLISLAQQRKLENLPPRLGGELVRSIICGQPYSVMLLQAALRRIHAGIKIRSKGGEVIERVTPEIAAIIKAYLNRFYRFYPNQSQKAVKVNLDITQPSIGYQLGRLFATLEKIQLEANKGINTTIRERFYGAACATPVAVFANLLRLKNHHLAKLKSKGRLIYFEQLIGEIMGKVDDFPAYLNLHEQGMFAIGYYHQRHALFETKGNGLKKSN